MKIEEIIKPDQFIVSITKKVKVEELPKVIGPTFMKLAKYIQENGIQIESAPFVCYKNMDENGNVDEKFVELEVGFPINQLMEKAGEFDSYFLPSYKVMTTLFVGKYSEVTPIYLEILERIKQIGGEFLHRSYEYYLSDEEIPEDQQETIIEIPYR